ncbi:MAG: hypothetical protein Q8O30_10590 [Candidatus Omnitrophota bacterium]|nr:hypothetical protein [Candidatus Omnitrophota bacterium]
MKKLLLVLCVFLVLHCISYASEDLKSKLQFGKILVKELELQPRESGDITIPAEGKLWVGFYIDFPKEAVNKYQDQPAFKIKDKNSVVSVSGINNGGTLFSPNNGIVEIIYENLTDESFPAIIWKKEKEK